MEFFSHILVCMCLIKVSRVVPSYSLDPVRMASSIQWKNMMSYTIRASLVAQMVRKWSEVKSLSHVRHFATPWTTCSLPGSSVHGIFQAIVREWIAISFSIKTLYVYTNPDIPWRRETLPTPVFWPREFHGLHSPWGFKELDTTEQLSLSSNPTPGHIYQMKL